MDLNYYIHTGKTVHEKLDKNLYVGLTLCASKAGLGSLRLQPCVPDSTSLNNDF